MTRSSRILAILLALLICMSGVAAFASGKLTTTGKVNLRSGPSLDNTSLGTVPKGTSLTYTESDVDDRDVVWYYVSYNGKHGWISSVYVKTSGDSTLGKVTTTGKVNLRSGPGLDFTSLDTVPVDTTLSYSESDVDERGVTWYRVSYGGKHGWISSVYTNKGGSSASGKVTTTGKVNLRSGPGLDYSSLGTVPDGTTLSFSDSDIDERGVTWYRVSYGGKHGWISSVYTSKGSGGSSASGKVTTTGKVNLRNGAGLDYSSLGTVPNGTTLSYTKTSVDDRGVTWYRVSYNGKQGWISSVYTSSGSGGSSSSGKVRATGSTNVRSGPSLDYKSVGTMDSGDTAPYKGEKKKDDRGVYWYKISFKGKTAWVSSKYTDLD